jgi:hypothetical protein
MGERPTVVVDTNVLLNLATPVVDGRPRAPAGEEPRKTVLAGYDVHIPPSVVSELADPRGNYDRPVEGGRAGVYRRPASYDTRTRDRARRAAGWTRSGESRRHPVGQRTCCSDVRHRRVHCDGRPPRVHCPRQPKQPCYTTASAFSVRCSRCPRDTCRGCHGDVLFGDETRVDSPSIRSVAPVSRRRSPRKAPLTGWTGRRPTETTFHTHTGDAVRSAKLA